MQCTVGHQGLTGSQSSLGWLCKIQMMNPSQFDELLDKDAYSKLTEDD